MRGYLLDTSVVSAFAPERRPLSNDLKGWLASRDDALFLPAVAVAEIEAGLCKLRRAGSTTRVDRLAAWLDGLIDGYGDHILPLDVESARVAGRLGDAALAVGRYPGFADVAIAAIAAHHELLILTRNVRHFAALDAAHADPFEALPA